MAATNDTTAQDVIDALRLVLTQDDLDVQVVRELVFEAPASQDESKGVHLLLDLAERKRLRFGVRSDA